MLTKITNTKHNQIMAWGTNMDDYSLYLPTYKRTYIHELPKHRRNNKTTSLCVYGPTTSMEYGNFYNQDRYPSISLVKNRRYNKFLTPLGPEILRQTYMPPPQSSCMYENDAASSGVNAGSLPPLTRTLNVKDIKDIDVQLVTNESVLGIMPNLGRYDHYSYPKGLRSVKLPEVEKLNVSFFMNDGSQYKVNTLTKDK